MDATQAKKLVIVGSAGTGILTAVKAASSGSIPAKRLMFGSLVMAVGLAALAEYQPPLAAGLATLTFATALFVFGGDAMTGISNLTKMTPTTPPQE